MSDRSRAGKRLTKIFMERYRAIGITFKIDEEISFDGISAVWYFARPRVFIKIFASHTH